MPEKRQNSFVPMERGSLPRILLLDFDETVAVHLKDQGYEIIQGFTGYSDDAPFFIPKHESEIEIIFWDTSRMREDNKITLRSGVGMDLDTHMGQDAHSKILAALKKYFTKIAQKGGFVGVFLGEKIFVPLQKLPVLLDSDFSFKVRRTSTLYLNQHKDDDIWFDFYQRFVKSDNVKFAIDWKDNMVNFTKYFEDEDDNIHAVTYRHFSIIPKVENKESALTYLLQDVLPHYCRGEDIFPDKYFYRWANTEAYLPQTVVKLQSEIAEIVTTANENTELKQAQIKADLESNEYLSNLLIADDSNLFTDDKKLSVSVHKVLQDDLGFKVTDVDEMRLQIGESLKEDKWIEDEDFFALVEIKGTEKGAKANWIRQDLTAHIREFEIVKDVKDINAVLIFNHERREAPQHRSLPFSGDTDLMTFAKKSNICLIPVYELFKLASAIRAGEITQKEGRTKIKDCKGMFEYISDVV